MAVTISGTSGITTPGVTNAGNETVAGTLQVGGVTTNVYPLVSGTAVASTSGTSIDFTSIPSWVKRITVTLSGVSTNGSSVVQMQVGAGSVASSGYVSASMHTSGAAVASNTSTAGFALANINVAADVRTGHMTLTNISGNVWVCSFVIGNGANGVTDAVCCGGGNITLGGTLDRVRITTVNGTDTFDAGSINILYE